MTVRGTGGDMALRLDFPYSSFRVPAFGDAMVATSQPIAAQAGLSMLARGGNAVDAALATAICLTVVEPTMNGVGGDAFALVWDGSTLHGLNASGAAPQELDVRALQSLPAMPLTGWPSVTVPGAVSAWAALSKRFGRLPFADLFGPAIRYAVDGFLVPYVVSRHWEMQAGWFANSPSFTAAFLPGGKAPACGQRFSNPDLARTLEEIARTGGESFYRGRLAGEIEAFARTDGGALRAADLAAHKAEWVEPLRQRYAGAVVHELPPNGQGIAALIALGILDRFAGDDRPVDHPERVHLAIEATRLGLSDLHREVAAPGAMRVSPAELLDPARLARLAEGIDPGRTSGLAPKPGRAEGTVYLAAADREGMMVSLIQSNYRGFGSGLVVPGTGIALHNRGACFSTDLTHPNAVAPGKRPMNTIIPGFLSAPDGRLRAAFGVMGGAIQAQAHVQVVMQLMDRALQPQAALDAPRWRLSDDGSLMVEHSMPEALAAALASKGHVLRPMPQWSHEAGAGQIIMRLDDGYVGASDGRRDGVVAAE